MTTYMTGGSSQAKKKKACKDMVYWTGEETTKAFLGTWAPFFNSID